MEEGTSQRRRRRLDPVMIEWHSLPEDLWLPIFSHLDVKTLIEKKQVGRSWRDACTEAIDAKQTLALKKVFSTNEELRQAVEKYCGYDEATDSYSQCTPHDAEEIVQTYGYPMNKWNVSTLQDFSYIFHKADTFNEDISSWNVSNAITMNRMFYGASAFDQDLSLWNVSNVTDMWSMFECAFSFNGNISNWDVSNVLIMRGMFRYARALDQDLSCWNVQNVTDMYRMFYSATSFQHNLSSWNVSNVRFMKGMFWNAKSFDKDISNWNLSTVRSIHWMSNKVVVSECDLWDSSSDTDTL
jgi:surface protein